MLRPHLRKGAKQAGDKMEQKRLIFTLGIFVILSILAFDAPAQESGLGSKHWTLISLNGRPVGNSKAYIEIDPATRRFGGNAGCNRMFGSVRASAREVTFSGVATTKMMCANDGAMNIESLFVSALSKTTRYKINKNVLSLVSGRRTLASFAAAPKAPTVTAVKLEDRKWALESIGDKPEGSLGSLATMIFSPDKGSVGGDTSCNAYGGNYSVSGNSISIVHTVSTMRACIEDRRMQIETSFLNGIRDSDTYKIEGNKLFLYRGRSLLLTFLGATKK
ncbi:MAG: META domain-containing protein [Acidobacteriota bacterium]